MVDEIKLINAGKPSDIAAKPAKNIAVIDDFTNKSIFIDGDSLPDVSHGEVVTRFIKEGLPDANVESFDAEKSVDTSLLNTITCLDKILAEIDKGKKYDALNLSTSVSYTFDEVSRYLNDKVTQNDLEQHKAEIKNWINSPIFVTKIEENGQQIRDVISRLDKISSKGTQIYVSAGNEGKEKFSLYSLAENVKAVGSLDLNKKKAKFSADNSLVTNWEQGVFKIHKVRDAKGNSGYDYTGDGTIDIPSDRTTTLGKTKPLLNLEGASFSTPKALVRDFKNH